MPAALGSLVWALDRAGFDENLGWPDTELPWPLGPR